jgi:hypothetical protein
VAGAAYRAYGVVAAEAVLDRLRHPSVHAMQPLSHGYGLCHVRLQLVKDEPLAWLPDVISRLTVTVHSYIVTMSDLGPVVYIAADGDREEAGCWQDGKLALGPLRSARGEAPRLLRRRETGAVNAALFWLDAPRSRGRDRAATLGLAERPDWNPASAPT